MPVQVKLNPTRIKKKNKKALKVCKINFYFHTRCMYILPKKWRFVVHLLKCFGVVFIAHLSLNTIFCLHYI